MRDVYNGVALVENARGSLEVALGDTIPGAGTVKSIERRGGGWIVIAEGDFQGTPRVFDERNAIIDVAHDPARDQRRPFRLIGGRRRFRLRGVAAVLRRGFHQRRHRAGGHRGRLLLDAIQPLRHLLQRRVMLQPIHLARKLGELAARLRPDGVKPCLQRLDALLEAALAVRRLLLRERDAQRLDVGFQRIHIRDHLLSGPQHLDPLRILMRRHGRGRFRAARPSAKEVGAGREGETQHAGDEGRVRSKIDQRREPPAGRSRRAARLGTREKRREIRKPGVERAEIGARRPRRGRFRRFSLVAARRLASA